MAIGSPKELKSRANERIAAEHEAEEPTLDPRSQRKRPDQGRFTLQVDRQTKRSFADLADAEAAGAILKKKFPLLQVAVYDTIEFTRKTIEAA